MAYLEELLPEFRKGAKIRQTDWDKEVFIRFYKDEIYWYDDGAWKDGKIASAKDLVYLFAFHKDDWELYQEPIDWDYIIKNKCLCWFWYEGAEERKLTGILANYDSDNSQFGRYRGDKGAVTLFDHCRPASRDEVTFYEDRKDE